MAQISIPMSNKVGYSMYWNSMWDKKINFSRGIREDIFLNNFVPYILDDKISLKTLKILNFNKLNSKKVLRLYNLNNKILNYKKKDFFDYINSLNKIQIFKTKIWILKYQQWIILYHFVYLPIFNTLKTTLNKTFKKSKFNNENNLFAIYKKTNLKLNLSYNFYIKNIKKNYF